jgi:hypothetical protein
MAETDRYAVPDVQDTVPIDSMINAIRKKIDFDCSILLQQARKISATKSNFSLKLWESRITHIKEAQKATFSLDELKDLNAQCQVISDQLGQFRA